MLVIGSRFRTERGASRLVSLGLIVALRGVGCSSGSSDETDTGLVVSTPAPVAIAPPQATAAFEPVESVPAVAVAAPELVGLGELAILNSPPVRQTFDISGGSMVPADGTRIEVPPRAIETPTELSVVIVDLLFGLYTDPGPHGRIYRLETVQDVSLV